MPFADGNADVASFLFDADPVAVAALEVETDFVVAGEHEVAGLRVRARRGQQGGGGAGEQERPGTPRVHRHSLGSRRD
jgi:hypothetical protein